MLRTALLGAVAVLAAAAETAALPVRIASDDRLLRFSGRWETSDKAGPRASWPACSVWLSVTVPAKGGSLNVELGGWKNQTVQIAVDGRPTAVITLEAGRTLYPLASDLAKGAHLIQVCKRNEAAAGPLQILGFQASAGLALQKQEAPKRRIEFLGDSITAGYGVEAASENEHHSLANSNAWLTWGAVAARTLQADYSCCAVSGIWLMSNGTNKPLPTLWDRVLPQVEPDKAWDFSRWQADAVVVNLGTNDAYPKRAIAFQDWSAAYRPFIAAIRKAYPKAHIFLAIGSMSHGRDGELAKHNQAIAAACAKDGDARVHAVTLALGDRADGLGADWHPSAKTQRKMADAIAAEIRAALKW